MFDPDGIYFPGRLARKVGRCTRTINLWRHSGVLPSPNVAIGRRHGWSGDVLNEALIKGNIPSDQPATSEE